MPQFSFSLLFLLFVCYFTIEIAASTSFRTIPIRQPLTNLGEYAGCFEEPIPYCVQYLSGPAREREEMLRCPPSLGRNIISYRRGKCQVQSK